MDPSDVTAQLSTVEVALRQCPNHEMTVSFGKFHDNSLSEMHEDPNRVAEQLLHWMSGVTFDKVPTKEQTRFFLLALRQASFFDFRLNPYCENFEEALTYLVAPLIEKGQHKEACQQAWLEFRYYFTKAWRADDRHQTRAEGASGGNLPRASVRKATLCFS